MGFLKPNQKWEGYYFYPNSGGMWSFPFQIDTAPFTGNGAIAGKIGNDTMKGTVDGEKFKCEAADTTKYEGIHKEGTISGIYKNEGRGTTGCFYFYHPVVEFKPPKCCACCSGPDGCAAKCAKMPGCGACCKKCSAPKLPKLPSLPKISLSFFGDQGADGKLWKGDYKAEGQDGKFEARLKFSLASGHSEADATFSDFEFRGSGSDSVGSFTIENGWTGTKESRFGGFKKSYTSHNVFYVGAWKKDNKKLEGCWTCEGAYGTFEFEEA